jgi:hypothetical protein
MKTVPGILEVSARLMLIDSAWSEKRKKHRQKSVDAISTLTARA